MISVGLKRIGDMEEKNMTDIKTYRKRLGVVAVRLDLDMEPLRYRKWGGDQQAKPGDWLVLSNGDTYTIDAEEFAGTYTETDTSGHFRKSALTYAHVLRAAGSVATLEGTSDYAAGDYLCASNPEMKDAYPVSRATFEATYYPVSLR